MGLSVFDKKENKYEVLLLFHCLFVFLLFVVCLFVNVFISVLALAYHLVWCSVQKAIDGGNSERMEKVRCKVREQVRECCCVILCL
jgi:hypothetical protein